MKLYDNALDTDFEELTSYYPAYYREVREMDALLKAFGAQLDGIRAGNVRCVDNCFVMTADRESLAEYEKFLGVTYDGTRTLDERRSMVASFFVGNGHIGQEQIKTVVRAFVDGDVSVLLSGGTIHIEIRHKKDAGFVLGDCLSILSKRIPAHLGLIAVYIPPIFVFKNKERVRLFSFGVNLNFKTYISERIWLDGTKMLDGSWHLGIDFTRVPILSRFGLEISFKNKSQIN